MMTSKVLVMLSKLEVNMRITMITLAFCLIANSQLIYSQESDWMEKVNEIQLLSHTYDDVVGILGTPLKYGDETRSLGETFAHKDGEFHAVFASGRCVTTDYSFGKPIGWLVPSWTVILVWFDSKKPLKPASLGLKLDRFRKYEVKDNPGSFVFEDEEAGVSFTVDREGLTNSIEFSPPKKLRHLHCK